jgi:hypothetical protein
MHTEYNNTGYWLRKGEIVIAHCVSEATAAYLALLLNLNHGKEVANDNWINDRRD